MFCFETGSYCVTQVSLKLLALFLPYSGVLITGMMLSRKTLIQFQHLGDKKQVNIFVFEDSLVSRASPRPARATK